MGRAYTNCTSGVSCGSTLKGSTGQAFKIKKGDTCPRYSVQLKATATGEGVSYQNWIVRANMYFESLLANDIDNSMEYEAQFKLKGSINFCQVKVGDVIAIQSCTQGDTEYMIVTEIDCENKMIYASRGYADSDSFDHKKGTKIIFYRIFLKHGYITSEHEDDPDTVDDEQDYSILNYQWDPADTTHAGDYLFEFKLNYPNSTQVRSFPVSEDGDYLIKII